MLRLVAPSLHFLTKVSLTPPRHLMVPSSLRSSESAHRGRLKQEKGHFVTLTPSREDLKAEKRPFRGAEPGGEERGDAKEKARLAIILKICIFGVLIL